MKTGLAMGAFFVIATVAGSSALAQLPNAPRAAAPADITVKGITLNSTTTGISKIATKPATFTADFVIAKTEAISSKKFNLGGMDADEAADPLSKITEAKCARYMLTVTVLKKNGASWDQIFQSKAHGEWYHSSAPGTIDRCKLKDGWNVAPTLNTKPLALGTGTDNYRVVVDSGFTAGSWPKNATEKLVERRKGKATITMVP